MGKELNWSSYPGGVDKAIADGIVCPIDSIMAKNAPALCETLAANNYGYNGDSTTSTGQHYGFPFITDGNLLSSVGMMPRADSIKQLGLQMPETPDEYTNVLTKMKPLVENNPSLFLNQQRLDMLFSLGGITSVFGFPNT